MSDFSYSNESIKILQIVKGKIDNSCDIKEDVFMDIIFDFNRTLYNPDSSSLFDDTKGILEYLKNHPLKHNLHLMSRGIKEGRENEIISSGITHYFKTISIVPEKNIEVFKKLNTDPLKTVVVGDVIWDEIEIGNKLGFYTVWFKNGKFQNDIPINKEQEPNFIITSLNEIKEIPILKSAQSL